MHHRSLVFALLVAAAAGCAVAPEDEEDAAASEDQLAHAPLLGPEPRGEPVENPIVLVHGFAASSSFNGFSDEVFEALGRAHGTTRVFRAQLPAFLPPSTRAEVLRTQILGFVGENTRVNIIAHSMGGLDSRYLASPRGLDWGSHIASITTISTPHRGTAVAGWLRDGLSRGRGETIANALLAKLGATISDTSRRADILEVLRILSLEGAHDFDNGTPDASTVTYYSWAGVSSVPSLLAANPNDITSCMPSLPNHHHVLADGRPTNFVRDQMTPILAGTAYKVAESTFFAPNANRSNDGLVPVDSAKHGTFMGCIPADHADEIGSVNPQLRGSGYEPVRFYLNLAYDLSHRGL